MKVQEVFTPNGYPEHTYVKQTEKDLENELERRLNTPNEIISLSGPSKSGKTVLIQKVVDDNSLIIVQGSGIDSPQDLWNEILDELEAPESVEETSENTKETGASISSEIKSRIPGLSAGAGGELQTTLAQSSGEIETYERSGMKEVVDYIIEGEYVILIDDFHYIDRDVQSDIAEELKEGARRGITICVALVPHRSDDLVRANSDLRGRVRTLDVGYWNESDLRKIAYKGFDVLNVDFSDDAIEYLAQESAGSPQLMQRLCLESCFEKGIERTENNKITTGLSKEEFLSVMKNTVEYAEHSSTFDILDSGPKTRGTERNTYDFGDNEGDVYRCLLRAIGADPPQRSFSYEELKKRTSDQCNNGNSPSGSSIIGSCEKMDELVKKSFPDERAIEWDETKQSLHIPDPYLLFYLRWSDRLNVGPGS